MREGRGDSRIEWRMKTPPVKLVARQKLDAIQRPFVACSGSDERAGGTDELLARSLVRSFRSRIEAK